MTLTWTVFHDQRLVEAVVRGEAGAADVLGFIRDMRAAGLRSYGKVIDFSYGAAELHVADIRALADAHAAGGVTTELRGPTAIVLDDQTSDDVAKLYAERSASTSRSFALFFDRRLALDWLKLQTEGKAAPP